MYSGFLTIFAALILGYLIPLKNPQLVNTTNHLVNSMVFVILGLMGANLATIDNLIHSIDDMLVMTITFFLAISVCNLLILPLLDWFWPIDMKTKEVQGKISIGLSETGKVIFSVVIGFIVGLIFKPEHKGIETFSSIFLHLLLFFIGMQLRFSQISIKQILLNKQGVLVALVVIITSLVGGVFAAWILDLPLFHGLAMASGFGWYSLSGILITEALGPIYGAVSFFNELLRELLAFMLIPLIIRRKPKTAIGYGGATTLDFTLPIIQSQGGISLVPIAIVSGFILSVAVPIFIGLFTSF